MVITTSTSDAPIACMCQIPGGKAPKKNQKKEKKESKKDTPEEKEAREAKEKLRKESSEAKKVPWIPNTAYTQTNKQTPLENVRSC